MAPASDAPARSRSELAETARRVALAVALLLVIGVASSMAHLWSGLFASGFPVALVVPAWMVLPVALFGFAYRRSPLFRELTLAIDLRFVVFFHWVRFTGIVFFVLHREGQMPTDVAMNAAIADLVISFTAPVVAFGLVSRSPFPRKLFIAWNVFGIGELVLSMSLATLYACGVRTFAPGIAVFARAAFDLPISLIPIWGVPIATTLHVVALLQVRHERWRWTPRSVLVSAPAVPTQGVDR